jgi:hypothetical protein
LVGSRNRVIYFWRLKNWIVGPLSEDKTSGSGFFIGNLKGILIALALRLPFAINGIVALERTAYLEQNPKGGDQKVQRLNGHFGVRKQRVHTGKKPGLKQ